VNCGKDTPKQVIDSDKTKVLDTTKKTSQNTVNKEETVKIRCLLFRRYIGPVTDLSSQGISERTEEFYLMDGKLVFAFIQDIGPKHEGKDTGEPGKEFYFDNRKLIKYVNTTGEKAKDEDAEMKMYESKLPLEVDELIEITKGSKYVVVLVCNLRLACK